jgi:thiamine pyrophosphate-dependent acetolactate synthase large subunit-like protein
MNCGEVTIKPLESYGVDTVFGIPGVHTLGFCRELKQIQDDMKFRSISLVGVEGANFDFVKLAEACGCHGVKVDSVKPLCDAIDDGCRADRLEAGTVYVNKYFNACTHSLVGGFMQSGYGREGMLDYVQTKSVWLSTVRNIPSPFG